MKRSDTFAGTASMVACLGLMLLPKSNLMAQDYLSAIYPVEQKVIGLDTLSSHLKGILIDSITSTRIVDAEIEFYTTRGDALSALTDSNGVFLIHQLPVNCGVKVIYRGNDYYLKRQWQFNTNGLSDPIQLKTVFYLVPN